MRTHRKTLFDLYEEKPSPLVPRRLRREVAERINYRGDVVVPLDEGEVRRIVKDFKEAGVSCIAVCLIFSFVNPRHELRIRDIIEEEFPEVDNVSLSSEILPTYKEYERTSTAVLNAYTTPVMKTYLSRIESELKQRGYEGDLIVMQGTGGVMTSAEASLRPVYTLVSGPAGGVMGGYYIAKTAGFTTVLTMDMGGTSFDVACVVDGRPDRKMESEIADLPNQHGYAVGLPTIDVRSIGAGGGSIAWIDKGGALRVGPQSAGSVPGPVCYARGGGEPTVTDANVVLGRYNPQFILGGDMKLDRDAAYRVIEQKLAGPLGVGIEEAALGILDVVNSNMSYAVRYVSVERGRDPREFVAVAFGGAGPSHAVYIAKEMGIPKVMVPPFPGCTSAFGILAADIQHHYLRTVAASCDKLDLDAMNKMYAQMKSLAEERLVRDGVPSNARVIGCEADLRYYGQAYELTIPVSTGDKITREDIEGIVSIFHNHHKLLYGHSFPNYVPELVNLRVTGIGVVPEAVFPKHRAGGESPHEAMVDQREVFWGEVQEFIATPIYDRNQLRAGNVIEGPAIVEQMDSTTVVPPGKRATIDMFRNILLDI